MGFDWLAGSLFNEKVTTVEAIKRFIVWVNYGLEGWGIYGSEATIGKSPLLRLDAIEGVAMTKGCSCD